MEKEGYPPLRIFGSALQGGEISLPGNVSSQYISAILMIAPVNRKMGVTLHLEGAIISRPLYPYHLAIDGAIWSESLLDGEYDQGAPPRAISRFVLRWNPIGVPLLIGMRSWRYRKMLRSNC